MSRAVDEYIAAFPLDRQATLQEIRALIRKHAPDAVETISYSIPTFDLNGRHLVHFAGFTNHTGFYPTGNGVEAFEDDLGRWEHSKGAIKFPLDHPLPADLIGRIVDFRVAVVSAQKPARTSRRPREE